jgi:FkbM family methyltransferase
LGTKGPGLIAGMVDWSIRRMFAFYSQQGEDCLLSQFFGHKTTGYFVDVGAFDGVYLSNSYAFERLGWSGICVEASAKYFELCKTNRPRSTCHHAACLKEERGMVEFREESGGLFSGVSTDENYAARCYTASRMRFDGFQTTRVPSSTLNGLLDLKVGEIDFVSIDVEGSELDVLAGFDLDRYRPRVLVIEANDATAAVALDTYLASRGYQMSRFRGWNRFYVCSEKDARALRAITVAAKLESPPHPLGPAYGRFGYPPDPYVFWPSEG